MHMRSIAGATYVVFLGFSSAAVLADPVGEFYKAKNLTLIIASGVGGGYDLYGRTLGRHIGKYIPGNPAVIIQNMEGAGGVRGLNYLARVAPRDGSVIQATYGSLAIRPMIDPTGIEYDPRALRWIGSSGTQVNTCFTWGTSPIKTLEQAKTRDVTAAATGAATNIATMPNLLNHLVGTKFKIILGYTSGGLRVALEGGEAESLCGMAYSVLVVSNPDWIVQKKINFLTQFGLKKIRQLPDVPLAVDAVKDPKDKRVFALIDVAQRMGQPYVAPPGVPDDRLAALRTAFDRTMKDTKFLEESARANQEVDPMAGPDMETMIGNAYGLPKDVIARYAELMSNVPVQEKKK